MSSRLKILTAAAVAVMMIVFAQSAFAAGEAVTPASEDAPAMSADMPPQGPPPEIASVDLSGPKILNISVEGNSQVVSDYILGVVTSKVGEPVDEEKLRKDAEAIYELGFFETADYKVTDEADGVNVKYVVKENPVVNAVNFSGNTVYTSDQLQKLIFTKPGMIFNRTFFRNDIQRIKEKYQSDGYVMASVADVQVNGNDINVVIVEPKISQIVIQGNKLTKTYVVKRYLKIKEGDMFNSNKMRLTLNRLQGVGFFSDVNVNFEPGEKPEDVIVVFTVEEGRTGKLGFNIAYGTQSGFGGGLSYENTNIGGRGYHLNVGFDLGDREEYWLSLEQPYMSGKVMAWKVGVYKRAWSDLDYYISNTKVFEYDRDKYGAYIGFGKKFRDESKYNWYVTLDWHKVTNDPSDADWDVVKNLPIDSEGKTVEEDLGDGNYASAILSLRRLNLDEYLPYSKGDVETINLQYGKASVSDTDYNYMKYWLETRFYLPVDKLLKNFFETTLNTNTDKPVLFAARFMIGASANDVPYEELYTIGGDTTLRGYDDDRYHGEKMMLGNLELRIPLQKAFSLVAFYDFGRAWRDGEVDSNGDEIGFGSDMGSAPGIGVRLNTPLGNLRLDYADGEEGKFHFGFGELF